MVHVPTPTKDTVEPDTVQTPVVPDVKLTGSPDVAVAVGVYVAPPKVAEDGAVDVKEIVWLA